MGIGTDKLNYSNKIKDPVQNKLILAQYSLYFFWILAVCVSSGIYLFNKETDITCFAPMSDTDADWGNTSQYINVSKRFNDILIIYFSATLVEGVRCIILLTGAITKVGALGHIYSVLVVNDCLSFAALIILHVYRFQYPGKVCACDYPERC